jgi:hypothetical protein
LKDYHPNKMPNDILNRITVKGNPSDVARFEQYIQSRIDDTHSAEFGTDVEFTEEGNGYLEFIMTTGQTPDMVWFNQIRAQFPMLKFTLFWTDQSETPNFGYIDKNNKQYEITGDTKHFILAAKIFDQYNKIQQQLTTLDNVNFLLQNEYIIRWEIDPSLQTWAVPSGNLPGLRINTNNPNKIITFYGREGQIYYVKARYDQNTNQILPSV